MSLQRCESLYNYNAIDWEGHKGLFRGLCDAADVENGLDRDEWKPIAMHRYKDDVGLLKDLLRRPLSFSSDNVVIWHGFCPSLPQVLRLICFRAVGAHGAVVRILILSYELRSTC